MDNQWDFGDIREMMRHRGKHAGELPVVAVLGDDGQIYADAPEKSEKPTLGQIVKFAAAQGGFAAGAATLLGAVPGFLGFGVFMACAMAYMACDVGM